MVITYYGISCFKIETGGVSIAINPFSKDSGLVSPRFEAKVQLATHENYRKSSIAGNPYSIYGPGEYDTCGINIRGVFLSPTHTAYIIEWDGMRMLHLGEFESKNENEVDLTLKEIKDEIDILFLPACGNLGPKYASNLMKTIEPRIVIPMNYKLKGMTEKTDKLSDFLKIISEKPVNYEKLSIKKKDLAKDKTIVAVLSSPYGIL